MLIKQNVQLYLFGDSICFGQLISGHRTWASSLAESLEGLNSEHKTFLVQNVGVNGNTTRQALERLNYDVTSHAPKYVLIQFGMNDCNIGKVMGGYQGCLQRHSWRTLRK